MSHAESQFVTKYPSDAHDSLSDTESINSRSGQSDADGFQPCAAPREEVVPAISVQLESSLAGSSGWRQWICSVCSPNGLVS